MDLLGDDGLLDLRKRRARTDPKSVVEEARSRQRELPDANAELEAWQQTERPAPKTDACHVCGKRPRIVCKSCDQGACAADSWVMLGLCRRCATEARLKGWNGRHDSGGNWLEDV